VKKEICGIQSRIQIKQAILSLRIENSCFNTHMKIGRSSSPLLFLFFHLRMTGRSKPQVGKEI
jgi:hypothetical protein